MKSTLALMNTPNRPHSFPKKLALGLTAALLFTAPSLHAAPGDVDTSFVTGSQVSGSVIAVAPAADGKMYVAGDFTTVRGALRNRIARLNADGTADPTFDPGTGADSLVYALAVQADGKVLIGGDFASYNGTGRNRIARLNSDGSLDTSFNPGTGASSTVLAVAVQADGKVLIGGSFSTYNDAAAAYLVRVEGVVSALPEIAVEQPVGTDLVDGTASVDLGSSAVGAALTPVSFTIKNTGTADLTGLGITIDGTNSGDFAVTASPTAPVSSPSGSTTFEVTFTPGGIGARTAALHIASNDADENPFDITLTGTGEDYTLVTAANELTVTDATGNGNALNISVSGGNLVATDAGSGLSQSIPLTGLTSLVINPGAGDDTVTIGDLSGYTGAVTINAGTGCDDVVINGPINTGGNAIDISASCDITVNGSVQSGAADLTLTADSDGDDDGLLTVSPAGSLATTDSLIAQRRGAGPQLGLDPGDHLGNRVGVVHSAADHHGHDDR